MLFVIDVDISVMEKFPDIYHYVDDRPPVLEEALTVWDEVELKRDNDLLCFIKDFINSDEYHEYLQKKIEKNKEDKATQYECVCPSKKKPKDEVLKRANNILKFIRFLNAYTKNVELEKRNKRHDNAAKIIKVPPLYVTSKISPPNIPGKN